MAKRKLAPVAFRGAGVTITVIENELVVREMGTMKKGQVILGHRHNFGHPTVVYTGALQIDLLRVLREDALGHPLEAEVEESAVVSGADPQNWYYVRAGRWHQLTALEDGTRYGCWYPFRGPTCITTQRPGELEYEPPVRIDEHGRRWVLVDESIATATRGTAVWGPAYR